MANQKPRINTSEAVRQEVENNLPNAEQIEKEYIQDITKDYLTKLKSDVAVISKKEINAFLQKPKVQESINKFRTATPDTLKNMGIRDKQRLLTAAVFYHEQLLGTGEILNNPDKYKFATKLTENTILDSNNHSVISNLLMPLFGELTVVTKKGNLIMRDEKQNKIGKLKAGSKITLDIGAEPSHYSKRQNGETHLYLAAQTSDGQKCYLAAEFLDASMNSQEFNEFFATGAQSDAMSASLAMFKLYNEAKTANDDIKKLMTDLDDLAIQNSGVVEARTKGLAAQESLESILGMTDPSKMTPVKEVNKHLEEAEDDQLVLLTIRQTLDTTKKAMQQANSAKIRLNKQIQNPTLLNNEEAVAFQLSENSAHLEKQRKKEQLQIDAEELELDDIDITKLKNKEFDNLIYQKFLNDPKAFTEEVNDSILGESPLSYAEDIEYIVPFIKALIRVKEMFEKEQDEIIQDQTKESHKKGEIRKKKELTKELDDMVVKLALKTGE